MVPWDSLRVTLGPFGQGDTENLLPRWFSGSPSSALTSPQGPVHGAFFFYWTSLGPPVHCSHCTMHKRKICNRRPLVGAVGAYKRGDARRKDSDLCFAHSRVLRTFTCASHIHLCFAHSLVLRTFTCAPHIHLCHIHLCFAHSLVLRTFTCANLHIGPCLCQCLFSRFSHCIAPIDGVKKCKIYHAILIFVKKHAYKG